MKTVKQALAVAVVVGMGLGSSDLLAQSLQIGGKSANYGTITLSPGFTPDPHTVSITSGGSLDVRSMDLGSGCVGYATAQPDLILQLQGSSNMLRFFNESDGDTGLAINDPSGRWHCSDDSYETLDPTVTINNASSGQYDIWVTSYSSGTNHSGTFSITELDSYHPGTSSGGKTSADLNIGGSTSNYGSISLAAGFTPDPHTMPVTSGGSVDIRSLSLGSGCVGYATENPDMILQWSGNSNMLRVFFEGDGDTALVINDPNGNWRCNDDSYGTTDPTVDFNNAPTGQYDIWVASYSSGNNTRGTLSITELESRHPGGD